MEQLSLIANSGIQLSTAEVEIDLNDNSRYLFHEWFDEDEVQTNLEFVSALPESGKVVRVADLENCKLIDEEGNLKVSEAEVLAIPNIKVIYEGDLDDAEEFFSLRLGDEKRCKLRALLNQWLPLPYFEFDSMGNQKNGPYNWARCKFVPHEEDSSVMRLNVLLAFDTRASYAEPDDYAECPAFVSDSETEKNFRLSGKALSLLDFCSGKNSWIRTYLMEMVHGVNEVDDIKVKNGERRYGFLASYLLLVSHVARLGVLPNVRLLRDRDVRTRDVEMIVDIGNSRTSAILFEENDFTKVKPLRLQNFTHPLTANGELRQQHEAFDMRLAFQKVSFGEKTMGGSKQFVWPSVVRLGEEAEYLTHETITLAEGDEVLSTYSSPKRYLWDEKVRREEWRCVRRTGKDDSMEPLIEGVSNFFRNDGSIDPQGFGVGLHYSRKTLMTLAFIEIISQARVQMNSLEYRQFHGKVGTPRRLQKVILTCPTALSHKELLSLHQSLSDALFVLKQFDPYAAGTGDVKIVPDVLSAKRDDERQWTFDEATCSQFVYLYGQFSETYLRNTQEFFNIYGRPRVCQDGEERDSLVIGSLDIGAGTSDVMICRYEYNADNPARLCPIPVFWDSFDTAGDDMLKMLIENVLIQGRNGQLERELARRGKDEVEIARILQRFFGSDTNSLSFSERILRRDFNLQVCCVVMNRMLALLGADETYRELSYDDLFAANPPAPAVLQRFEDEFGFPLNEIRWIFDSSVLANNIEHALCDLLENVATIMYANDCDLVLLSGRPTSLWPIRDLFLKYSDGQPFRVVQMNRHRVGRWYPFADEFGYLCDGKSVVAIGAMVGDLASNAGGLNGFSLDLSELADRLRPTTDYFIEKDAMAQKNKPFITPEESSGELVVNAFPCYIGCRQFNFSMYPVRPFYVLDIDQESIVRKIVKAADGKILSESEKQQLLRLRVDKLMQRTPLTFTIERTDFDEHKEELTIASVDSDGDDISASDFSLTVQSLNDPECYWLDNGAFNINIKL